MEKAHPRQEVDYWALREYWNMPLAFRDRVCHGYRREETAGHSNELVYRRGAPICADCERPKFWFYFICVHCGEPFIRDFSDPRFCPLYPHCWDHLSNVPFKYCPDHGVPVYRNDVSLYPTRPPAGFNPRRFTDEELANVFDF